MNWSENSIAKLRKAKKALGNRTGPNVRWLDEKEDDSKLRICSYDLEEGIPTFSSVLNDFEEGIACLAGKPNNGKSTILVNMMLQACKLNKDILVIDISLDDPYKKRFEQYIASLTGLVYQEITTRTDLSPEKVTRKEQAEALLEQFYTDDTLRTIEAIEKYTDDAGILKTRHYREPEEIFRLMKEVRDLYPERKIVIFIDAWNNLDISKAKGTNELSQYNHCLNRFQEEANKLGIMVMVSAHLRKGEGKRKLGLDDIKGTSDMAYTAVWAGIVINELREKVLDNPLYYEDGDKIYPIVTIEIAKTKVSTWDLPMHYILKSGQCGLEALQRYQYITYRDKYMSKRD